MYEGMNAVQTQTYGPEARGGATRADVVISNKSIHYPKVINPHILVCLTQESYNKFSDIVRPGGLLVTDTHYVKQERVVDARQVQLGMYEAVMEEIGRPIVLNICMLGALIGLTQVVKAESILKALEEKVDPKFMVFNEKALELGLRLVNHHK